MRVYCPHTELQPWTRHLLGQDAELVALLGRWGYTDYLQERWDEREDFINVEHDIVFWDGALEALWDCPHPWCVYPYKRNETYPPATPNFGCVKLTSRLMDKIPEVWERQRTEIWGPPPDGYKAEPWSYCDSWLWHCAQEKDIGPHQHFPPVINLNPAWLHA